MVISPLGLNTTSLPTSLGQAAVKVQQGRNSHFPRAEMPTPSIGSVAPKEGVVKESVNTFLVDWQAMQGRNEKLLHELPPSFKPLFEAQLLVNRVSLESQLITKGAESFSSTLKRLQQMGG